jgi:threonine aldolase
MKEAMWAASLGDDVYGEDPAVNQLQEMAADMFGMEASLFCPSGTMTNQIAIRIHARPREEVICDRMAHIYNYEGGGIAANALASVRLIHSSNGIMSAEDIADNINPDDIHYPRTRLVALENTVNKGGGCCYTLAQIAPIAQLCREKGLALHLDGARLFNALVANKESARHYGNYFDSISICLSKGLGAPVGSLLLGNMPFIKEAIRVRKMMGGGMRQAGMLAAAGTYALQHHVERLAEDHRRAAAIAEILSRLPFVKSLTPVFTNIVIFQLTDGLDPAWFSNLLKEYGILANPFGKGSIRMVTHLDFNDENLLHLGNSLVQLSQKLYATSQQQGI